ncbi:hypothetical protein KAM330_15000 [Aeromonas hydrophila]|nr:hypothetical protein KAM330_15000 [Aeromonas hydrophila]
MYFWADGIYSNVRMGDRLCLLVIIGVTEHGNKKLVAVEDGLRESESSWTELLLGLRAKGLDKGTKLAVDDGALGFWRALAKYYPDTVHQRCWVHKTANVLAVLPKSVHPKEMEKLTKDWELLLAFYDFPADHWVHIRTTNPIESTFSTVRLRSNRARNCGSRETTLAMVYKLLEVAQKK